MFYSKDMGEIWHTGFKLNQLVNWHLKNISITLNTQNAEKCQYFLAK